MATRAVPNIRSDRPVETREFFVDLFGFEVVMDLGWVMTVASPENRSVQITIISNDDPSAPGISVGVADVDAVHARAVELGYEIAYPLRDEEWGVRRFMLRDPNGTIVNVVSHRPVRAYSCARLANPRRTPSGAFPCSEHARSALPQRLERHADGHPSR